MSIWAKLVLLLVAFAAGGAVGIKWELGVQARADVAAADARMADAKVQFRTADKAAGKQANTLAKINNQLGDAREKIANLSGRECLSGDTVRVLNTIGSEPVPAAASDPASAAAAAAAGTGIRSFATERDTAGYIALCRARYAEVAGQLDQILDVEDARTQKAQP